MNKYSSLLMHYFKYHEQNMLTNEHYYHFVSWWTDTFPRIATYLCAMCVRYFMNALSMPSKAESRYFACF